MRLAERVYLNAVNSLLERIYKTNGVASLSELTELCEEVKTHAEEVERVWKADPSKEVGDENKD